jgi:two-component system, OmpR family, sensor histidine kinase KdpD
MEYGAGYNHAVNRKAQLALRTIVCGSIVPSVVLLYTHAFRANTTTIALTFLLAVLVISAYWGFWYAAGLAVLSALAFNFYFLPPTGTLTIADPQNWIALTAFLATAIIAGQLSDRVRREAVHANQRRREIERLYAFSRHLLTLESVPALLNLLPPYIVESFGGTGAAIFVSGRNDVYRSSPETRQLDLERLQSVAARGEPVIDSGNTLAFVPLRLGVRSIGAIGISGVLPSQESLDALATLVALAIERTRAIENVGKAEASRENEKLRSAILDSVAHEFRTPLTAVKASVTSLLSGALDSKQQTELLTVINEETDRLNHLVEEATQMARLETDQVELDLRPHNIREAIDHALEVQKKSLSGHPVDIKIVGQPVAVAFDMELMVNVLTQLLENAAKYSPALSPIHIVVESKDSQITVSVADHGQGIDELEQALIFDKFYRGKDSRYSVQGTGMGLAIAKAVVEAHGGTVSVTSQPGQGSVFSFNLPRRLS